MTTPLVLDCTLRDGGYCNDWNWSKEQAQQCYLTAVNAGCDVCEVGLRRTAVEKGILFYAPEETLTDWFGTLRAQNNTKIALMAQMGTFTAEDFPPKKDSVVDMVRILIAYHSVDKDDSRLNIPLVEETVQMAETLTAKGYMVSINVGRADKLTEVMWNDIFDRAAGKVDVFYFADTYGSMTLENIEHLNKLCCDHNIKAGFHFHNNLENGGEKARYAMKLSCAYIDGTMGGYGRGSGNTKLEYICQNPLAVLRFVDQHLYGYQDAKDRDYQGYNVLYFLAAMYKFHVNYANELIHDQPKRDVGVIAKAFEFMKSQGKGNYYAKGMLDHAFGSLS
jgi:4-hydroxy 2-oxovalerate aldolase